MQRSRPSVRYWSKEIKALALGAEKLNFCHASRTPCKAAAPVESCQSLPKRLPGARLGSVMTRAVAYTASVAAASDIFGRKACLRSPRKHELLCALSQSSVEIGLQTRRQFCTGDVAITDQTYPGQIGYQELGRALAKQVGNLDPMAVPSKTHHPRAQR